MVYDNSLVGPDERKLLEVSKFTLVQNELTSFQITAIIQDWVRKVFVEN